ncbi:MAG: fimbrillin family protein [Candidatus Cryptobacteroides sp.]
MKKTIFCLATVTVLLAGCQKENIENAGMPEDAAGSGELKEMVFTATLDQTRAVLSGYSVTWQMTDKIAVYDGKTMREFTADSVSDDGTSATFSGRVDSEASDFYAVAPYSAASNVMPGDNGVVYFNLPAEQIVSDGQAADNALIALAAATKSDAKFEFSNAVSLIKVAVPDGTASVTLKAVGEVKIAGETSAAIDGVPSTGTASEVVLKPVAGTFAAGDYCLAVLPGTFTGGFSLVFADEDKTTTYSTTNELTISRNQLAPINYSTATKSVHYKNIRTADELRAFAASAEYYSADETVAIAADIDLEGQAWTPFELRCTFDGRGHRIKGLNISTDNIRCGFVSILDEGAVMQNIVFGSADGENYDGTSALEYTGTSAAYQGLVAECLGTVSNVKSFVSVKHAGTDPGMRLGGIAGCVRSNGIINACEYAGTISFEAATSTANHFVGGIAGRMHETLADGTTISGSTFSGKIVIANDRVQGTGGIVGIMQGGNISNCISKGVVEISESYTNDSHFGGIAAYIQTGSSANTASITECTNATTLSASAYLCSVGGIVGDIHNYSKLIRIENCANNADITVAVAPIAQSYLSGIVGFVRDGSSYPHEITACTNNGKISYSNALSAASTFQIYTAGVLGFSKNSAGVALKDCVNNGAVSSDLYAVNSVAGIAGYLNNTSSVANCTNNAAITLNPSEEVQLGWQGGVAGIAAWLGGACKLTGNENKGDVIMNINSSSPSHAAGGIVALTDADDAALESNVNRGGISLTTTHKQAAVGGILGITKSSTTLSGNANYGSVSFIKPGETGDSFAGGVIGKIDCGAAAKTITMTKDKSLGAIVSPLRAAVLFSVIAWNETPAVTLTLSECGVGGSVNGTVVTEENYGSYLWSWKPSSVSVTGAGTCTFVTE